MIKGIIFDYGGTLDSGGDHWSEVLWKAWQNAGVRVDKETFREAYVWSERELAKTRHILPNHNFHDLLLIKVRLELEELVRIQARRGEAEIADAGRLEMLTQQIATECYESARSWVEKARPLLADLSKRYPLVLVSNFYGNVECVLTDFDLMKYFREIVESAVVGVRKPDPAIFGLGVKALGLKPEEVLVVGDSLKKDILPAESLGCKTAWLKGKGWTDEEDAQTHPTQIADLTEINKFLK